MYRAKAGSAQRKMRSGGAAKGDHPLRIAAGECRGRVDSGRAPSWVITVRGRQTRRKATMASSEKTEATMSTRFVSTKFDQ